MAMTTAVAGTSTAVIQRSFLGSSVQGLRPQQAHGKVINNNIFRSLTAKLASKHDSEQDVAAFTDLSLKNVLAGAVFTALANADSAVAAQQVMDLAADSSSDSRGLALLVPLVPAVGWVLFNILQPGLNQFNRMKNAKGVAIGFGLGALATLAISSNANAVSIQELAEIAEGDSRGLAIFGVLVPAVGWVLYNILQPALNQLNRMKATKGFVVGAAGLGTYAALFSSDAADAAGVQEIASIAEGDNRGLLLLLVILPAIGWVLFNILQPALNQLNKMQSKK